jgi:DNA-binding PadR family transcriptional regulator
MPSPPDPRAYLPLTPLAFHVLLALADGPRHGYGIILDVRERSSHLITLGTGTLYTMLRRLLSERLVDEARNRPADDDERRRYYRLTPLGRAVVDAEARRLETLIDDARRRKALPRPQKS